ncbi:venom protease isoform X3 [Anabrus simplex]|uniref:venom protease isoform X3 n=1 Tax=Anabrus simplex TaxID=316456 RepID=UPI0035A2B69B
MALLLLTLLSVALTVEPVSQGWFYRHPPLRGLPPAQCDIDTTCLPFSYCTSLRPDTERKYCRWGSGEPYICCPLPQMIQQCGVLNSRGYAPKEPILGAAIGGFSLRTATVSPWMVAVGERMKNGSVDWYCGGSLLRDNRVLTAAHCVTRRKAEMVRVGELDFSRDDEDADPFDVAVSNAEVHPNYKPPAYYNDLAVLKLAQTVKFGRYVKPICLPEKTNNSYEGAVAILTGWGYLSFGGDKSPVLQEVSVTVFNNEECRRLYSRPEIPKQNFPEGIISSQMCAGDRRGGKDACQGDSGGPLVVNNNGIRTLIGVVSSGIGCGSKAFPGVYSRITEYVDWIEEQFR